jgi:sortase A
MAATVSAEAPTEVLRTTTAPSSKPETAPARAATWDTRRVARIAGAILLGLGVVLALFVAFEFLFSGLIEQRNQRALLPQLQSRMQITTFDARTEPIPSGPIGLIQIPSLGVSQVVVQGSTTQDLQQGPGHLDGTPLPGEFGNAVIVGHRRLYGGPFSGLPLLHVGDQIVAVTGQGRFVYHVEKIVTVRPGQSDVVSPSLDSRLSLVTSGSLQSGDRVAVIAKLQGHPVGLPHRAPVAVPAEELGITGNISGLLMAILWGQVLAVALVLGVRAFRVWPRSISYLIVVPPVLMLLWLVFASLDRFLPGTL